MAELADALDSGSSESNFMEVQVLLPAPKNPQKRMFLRIFLCLLLLFLLADFTILRMPDRSTACFRRKIPNEFRISGSL